MLLLGLRIDTHDSSISLYDGTTLRYLKTERTHQVKHHISYGLYEWRKEIKDTWGIDYMDLDGICVSVLNSNHSPDCLVAHTDQFPAACPVWTIDHHYAHSLSYASHCDYDVSFVIDGEGSNNSSWSVFKGDKLVERGTVTDNGSVGIAIASLGIDLGIKSSDINDIAGKLMALQSYGKFDISFYNTLDSITMYNIKDLFLFERWQAYVGDSLMASYSTLDWVNTIHKKMGDVILDFFSQYCNPDDVVHYSGGVAQNIIWNTELKKRFKNLVIDPHCNDEGISLGAVEWLRLNHKLPRIDLNNFPYSQSDEAPDEAPSYETIVRTANLLASGKIIAWYQGNGEVGPRALGNRSILMDPRIAHGSNILNGVKRREKYRPFGASILLEHADEYFEDLPNNPYMLYVGTSKKNLPSITHVDGTCRVQTVEKSTHPFRILLECFYKITGCPVLLNTSLNIAGKPIASYQHNAQQLFAMTSIDYSVIGNNINSDKLN